MANATERARQGNELSAKAQALVEDEGLTVAEALTVEKKVEAGADEKAWIERVKSERVGANAEAAAEAHVPGGNTAPPNVNATAPPERRLAEMKVQRARLDRDIKALEDDIQARADMEEATRVPQPDENEVPVDGEGVELTVENGEVAPEDADTTVEGDNGGGLRTSSEYLRDGDGGEVE